MLREYSLQIREIYQSLIEEKQNKTIKLLTGVTTIFLPLTLITGWYGMNFINMPELQWKYGYVMIIFISFILLIICLWIFIKNKYF